jgi:signal transduction histidine kinase
MSTTSGEQVLTHRWSPLRPDQAAPSVAVDATLEAEEQAPVPTSPLATLTMGARLGIALTAVAVLPLVLLGILLVISGANSPVDLAPIILAIAIPAAVAAAVVARVTTLDLHRGIRNVTRAARRLSAGQRLPDQVECPGTELRELVVELRSIDQRSAALRADLEHTQLRSGVELGRRSDELHAWQVETARWQGEAAALYNFAAAINQTVDPAIICSQLIAHIADSVDFRIAVAYLVDPSERELYPVFIHDQIAVVRHVGQHLRELQAAGLISDYGDRQSVAWVAQTHNALRVSDQGNVRFRRWLRKDLRSSLVVPLVVGDQTRGVVSFIHTEPERFSAEDERVVTALTRQAAMALENARLLEEAAKVEAYRELDRLKSELLSNVSHELRTPLASVKGYAESLLREDVEWSDAERHEFLTAIDEESDHLEALIEDLLQMSHIEAGRLQIHLQDVHLRKIAFGVARKLRIQGDGHPISVSVPADLPPVLADQKRVQQVLTNLIANAIKYSPEGGNVRVRGMLARCTEGDAPDYQSAEPTHVVLAVADEGIGIPAESLERIFDRFYRVQNDTTSETRGSGLGLAISKSIVEAHGGRLWAESPGIAVRAGQTGKGSTFYFSLPIFRQASSDEAMPADDAAEQTRGEWT